MTGLELAEMVRQHASRSSTPIILMSGAQTHIAAGRPDLFTQVFAKPFDIDVVVSSVIKLLGHPKS
jgi:DNA-binding response OmpR family regulator